MSERKPTCPECGGHRFYETSRVDIIQLITRWDGEDPDNYESPDILWDTCESYDEHQFTCADCGKLDLDISDLFPEE